MAHSNKRRKPRALKRKLPIVVEGAKGKSEQIYFQTLAQKFRSEGTSTSVSVIPGKGEPSLVLSKVLALRKRSENGSNDRYILVVDVDQHTSLNEVLKDCSKEKGIDCVVTNPQFELWLLWHVREQTGPIEKRHLNNETHKLGITKGKRGKEINIDIIDAWEDAVMRARKSWPKLAPNVIPPNPGSSIPWLIDEMRG